MESIKKLYIEYSKEETKPKDIRYENLGWYYDLTTGICIYKRYIECDLNVGFVYDFTFEDYNDVDTYSYVVLKKEDNVYYLAEFYNKFIRTKENLLGNDWVKCDVKETLAIDLVYWQTTKIQIYSLPNMRKKVEEYISELEQEIETCANWILENGNYSNGREFTKKQSRMYTLIEVKNDLKSRLSELI